ILIAVDAARVAAFVLRANGDSVAVATDGDAEACVAVERAALTEVIKHAGVRRLQICGLPDVCGSLRSDHRGESDRAGTDQYRQNSVTRHEEPPGDLKDMKKKPGSPDPGLWSLPRRGGPVCPPRN